MGVIHFSWVRFIVTALMIALLSPSCFAQATDSVKDSLIETLSYEELLTLSPDAQEKYLVGLRHMLEDALRLQAKFHYVEPIFAADFEENAWKQIAYLKFVIPAALAEDAGQNTLVNMCYGILNPGTGDLSSKITELDKDDDNNFVNRCKGIITQEDCPAPNKEYCQTQAYKSLLFQDLTKAGLEEPALKAAAVYLRKKGLNVAADSAIGDAKIAVLDGKAEATKTATDALSKIQKKLEDALANRQKAQVAFDSSSCGQDPGVKDSLVCSGLRAELKAAQGEVDDAKELQREAKLAKKNGTPFDLDEAEAALRAKRADKETTCGQAGTTALQCADPSGDSVQSLQRRSLMRDYGSKGGRRTCISGFLPVDKNEGSCLRSHTQQVGTLDILRCTNPSDTICSAWAYGVNKSSDGKVTPFCAGQADISGAKTKTEKAAKVMAACNSKFASAKSAGTQSWSFIKSNSNSGGSVAYDEGVRKALMWICGNAQAIAAHCEMCRDMAPKAHLLVSATGIRSCDNPDKRDAVSPPRKRTRTR